MCTSAVCYTESRLFRRKGKRKSVQQHKFFFNFNNKLNRCTPNVKKEGKVVVMVVAKKVHVRKIENRREKFFSLSHCKTHSISIKTAVYFILCNVLVAVECVLLAMAKNICCD